MYFCTLYCMLIVSSRIKTTVNSDSLKNVREQYKTVKNARTAKIILWGCSVHQVHPLEPPNAQCSKNTVMGILGGSPTPSKKNVISFFSFFGL